MFKLFLSFYISYIAKLYLFLLWLKLTVVMKSLLFLLPCSSSPILPTSLFFPLLLLSPSFLFSCHHLLLFLFFLPLFLPFLISLLYLPLTFCPSFLSLPTPFPPHSPFPLSPISSLIPSLSLLISPLPSSPALHPHPLSPSFLSLSPSPRPRHPHVESVRGIKELHVPIRSRRLWRLAVASRYERGLGRQRPGRSVNLSPSPSAGQRLIERK